MSVVIVVDAPCPQNRTGYENGGGHHTSIEQSVCKTRPIKIFAQARYTGDPKQFGHHLFAAEDRN
jgi:hypothetical protein